MGQDPEVMRYLPGLLSRDDSDAMALRIRMHFDTHGYGLWAVETSEASFIGFVGLTTHTFPAHFTPCVEVGWRLARAHWNKGYASEGAEAALAHGFGVVGLEEIVSMTVPENAASRRVMEKIGLVHDVAGDFEHPRLPPGHRLRLHVLYRLRREAWLSRFHGRRVAGSISSS